VKSSHPPTLLTLARRALTSEIALPRGARVLVAVSGGPDSMALLDVLAALQAPLDFAIVGHGVDHGLRAEASSELDLAEAHAKKIGVAFSRTRVAVAPGGNLQARARAARHAALEVARKKNRATLVATAHHANDRAETVLMRLFRGAGPSGLAVLPARDGRLVRPLIRATRSDVALHLERHGVPFVRDPSNDDRAFLRVRVRHELLPVLETLDENIVAHLCALADDLAEAHEKPAPYRIGRAARVALAKLAAEKKSARGEVLLPGGIVATRKKNSKKR
jgi:tRNA(Ile)-lysidine synthase